MELLEILNADGSGTGIYKERGPYGSYIRIKRYELFSLIYEGR